MWVLKVKVISLPYIFQVLCFTNVKISGERLQDQWSSGYTYFKNIRNVLIAVFTRAIEYSCFMIQKYRFCLSQFEKFLKNSLNFHILSKFGGYR